MRMVTKTNMGNGLVGNTWWDLNLIWL